MDIVIKRLLAGDQINGMDIDDTFIVESILVLSLIDGQIGYTVKEISSYKKSYKEEQPMGDSDGASLLTYIDNPDRIMYLATVENQAIGRISLKRNWNNYAYIEDIAVDKHNRRYGVGRQLIREAKRWAEAGGMAGIMLETQNNNVQACKFYERCGFMIGGFDAQLYKGIDAGSDEIAIFWYLMLDKLESEQSHLAMKLTLPVKFSFSNS